MESLRDLISQHHATGYNIRLSPRPEFFAGRGIGYCDINVDKLSALLAMIHEVLGPKASHEALLSVMSLRELTATDVLLAVYEAEARGWAPAKKRGDTDLASHLADVTQKSRDAGMAAMFGIIACGDRGASPRNSICSRSESIKLAVLQRLGFPCPTTEKREVTSHMSYVKSHVLDFPKFEKLLTEKLAAQEAAA